MITAPTRRYAYCGNSDEIYRRSFSIIREEADLAALPVAARPGRRTDDPRVWRRHAAAVAALPIRLVPAAGRPWRMVHRSSPTPRCWPPASPVPGYRPGTRSSVCCVTLACPSPRRALGDDPSSGRGIPMGPRAGRRGRRHRQRPDGAVPSPRTNSRRSSPTLGGHRNARRFRGVGRFEAGPGRQSVGAFRTRSSGAAGGSAMAASAVNALAQEAEI